MPLRPPLNGPIHGQIDHPGVIVLPKHLEILTLERLRFHLQTAIELEHSTIPTYLTALYSIKDGTNRPAAAIIRSVVMEEMLHLTLAANVLNAIGGTPSINHPKFVPEYPTTLPHSDGKLIVGLERLSPSQVTVFCGIEKPARPFARPESNNYQTIGQFYAAIRNALIRQSRAHGIFHGDPKLQVGPEQYYGAGGEVIAINADTEAGRLEQAITAIDQIIHQGEGVAHTIGDGDAAFGQEHEVAHYFRFNQIAAGRYYQKGDTPRGGPTGAPLPVNYAAVYPIRANAKLADYTPHSDLWKMTRDFNHAYTNLLDILHNAFNGQPDTILQSVIRMYELRDRASALCRSPTQTGENAAPSFEYYRPNP